MIHETYNDQEQPRQPDNAEHLDFCRRLFPSFGAGPASDLSLTHYVNPFIGTEPSPGSNFGIAFDTGNVYPGAVAPRGMFAWSPDTTHANKISSGYWYPDKAIEGFGLTHFSGRGVVCLKDIPFLPTIQPVTASPRANFSQFALTFSHDNESASPGYYRVRADNGIETELTVSTRAGLAQFHFPAKSPSTPMIRAGSSVTVRGNEVYGYRKTAIGGGKRPYTIYFSAGFEQPFQERSHWKSNELDNATEASAGVRGAVLTFDPAKHPTVRVRVAISYVSVKTPGRISRRKLPIGTCRRPQADRCCVEQGIEPHPGGRRRRHPQNSFLHRALSHLHPSKLINDVNGQYTGMDEKVHTVARGACNIKTFLAGISIVRTRHSWRC